MGKNSENSKDENSNGATYTKPKERELTRENYYSLYETYKNSSFSFVTDNENQTQVDQSDDKQYWADFYHRSWAAWLLSGAYGGLQAWGMAGFVLSMTEEVDLDPWISHLIALGVALPVALMNGWLVRPDWEKYIVFKQYEKLFDFKKTADQKISNFALFCCGVSAILLGVVTAYGITECLKDENAYLHTEDNNIITAAMAIMTAILAMSECLLNIESFDRDTKKLTEQFTDFWKTRRWTESTRYDIYKENSSNILGFDVKKRTQAAFVYNATFTLSVLGMIGIALVGTEPFAHMLSEMFDIENEDTAMGIAAGILILAAFTQIPFYRDRAEGIMKRCIKTDGTPDDNSNNIFTSTPGKATGGMLWLLNGVFNSPCAYIGVVGTLGHFANLEKPEAASGSVFEKILCPFGTGDTAMIIYGVGTAFFLFALAISLVANYPPVKKMADPEKEYQANLRNASGI